MTPNHHFAEFLASILEIVGTFFLAVEAIKLSNLHAIRDRFFQSIINRLSPRIFVRVGESSDVVAKRKDQATFRFILFLTGLAFTLLLLIAVVLAGSPHALLVGITSQLPASAWAAAGSILAFGILAFGLSCVLGIVLYSIVLLPFRLSFTTLKFIEDNTANGVIGILGFLLYLVGAIAHICLK